MMRMRKKKMMMRRRRRRRRKKSHYHYSLLFLYSVRNIKLWLGKGRFASEFISISES
jgi:hypothetical protein